LDSLRGWRATHMATTRNGLAVVQDSASVLARLRQAEAALASELTFLRQAIAELAAVMETPPPGVSLLTVVEAARELRVSRTRVFQLLASGDLEGVRIGRVRCVPRCSIDAYLGRLGAA
jgi:excisionase family DNA binding protein